MTGGVLVLGIGNLLMGDDGVGIQVIRALPAPPALPPGTEVVEGGTAGLALLPLLAAAGAAVLVDAVDLGAAPGSVHLLPGLPGPGGPRVISMHQAGCSDLLAAGLLAGLLPDRVEIVGIQPAGVTMGLQLGTACRAAVPAAAELVIARVRVLATAACQAGPPTADTEEPRCRSTPSRASARGSPAPPTSTPMPS